MDKLWRYFAVTCLAFGIVGIYVLAAFNLKVFNPVAEILEDYSFTDFYYKLLDTGERETSRIVTIVDMTALRKRRDFAQLFMEVDALHPKAVGVDVVFEGYKEEDLEGDTLLANTVKQLHSVKGLSRLILFHNHKGNTFDGFKCGKSFLAFKTFSSSSDTHTFICRS